MRAITIITPVVATSGHNLEIHIEWHTVEKIISIGIGAGIKPVTIACYTNNCIFNRCRAIVLMYCTGNFAAKFKSEVDICVIEIYVSYSK